MSFKAPRGTRDILPSEIEKWQYVEGVLRKLCREYGYSEIRTPLFEETGLFARGVGEGTDIVEKEMYTFKDRAERSLTLRPECTASVVRSFLEHKLFNEPQPQKFYYIGPMFRYDRPQAGRYRQFHQFGVEAFGTSSPVLDTEVIAMSNDFFQRIGLDDLNLEINSVGCKFCRPAYNQLVLDYYKNKLEKLCTDCHIRYERNPLRILDCKNEKCLSLVQDAPSLADNLCEECATHFSSVLSFLDSLNIRYSVNHRLVRGLDYYTKTAFEFVSAELGAQSSLGGGGRYDNLVEICGGPPTPGVGVAMGLERVILALDKRGFDPSLYRDKRVFVALAGDDKLQHEGLLITQELRRAGISAELDFMGRSLKSQMKFAGKNNFSLVIILGEKELKEKAVLLRDMQNGEQEEIKRSKLIDKIKEKLKRQGKTTEEA
ncbi:MAG: histidine--tRNA ligase [Dethiobacteria bacterium]|jgi:histidyl-tRNA synthetase|nr:histidine--tRNA ligase [Bacillota bacterium]